MTSNLVSRVTVECALAVGVVAIVSTWLAGVTGAVGALAGGAIAVLNFRWLVRAGLAACVEAPSVAGSVLMSGLRLLLTFAALGAVLATGWAHPLALVAGLAVLPWNVVCRGLAASRHPAESR